MVLDLRGNGGGLLNEAVLMASLFLRGRRGRLHRRPHPGRRDYEAIGDALEPPPMVVLINRDTASAAEILAAALGDDDLATIVGTRSFGKGVFQEVIELANGGALDLTIGEYLTADGRRWPARGSSPTCGRDDPDTPRRGPATRRSRCSRASSPRAGEPPPEARRVVGVVSRAGASSSLSRCSSAGPQVPLAKPTARDAGPRWPWSSSGQAPACVRAPRLPERARDVVEALLWERGEPRLPRPRSRPRPADAAAAAEAAAGAGAT